MSGGRRIKLGKIVNMEPDIRAHGTGLSMLPVDVSLSADGLKTEIGKPVFLKRFIRIFIVKMAINWRYAAGKAPIFRHTQVSYSHYLYHQFHSIPISSNFCW